MAEFRSNLFIVAVIALAGCSGVGTDQASVTLSVSHDRALNSSLVNAGGTDVQLSTDYCYAIMVSGDSPQLNRAQITNACPGTPSRLGAFWGLKNKGESIQDIYVPVGTDRRFDLIGFKKIPGDSHSSLPNDCSGVFTVDPIPAATVAAGGYGVGHDVQVRLNGVEVDPKTVLIATATTSIVDGDNPVALRLLSDANGVSFDCKNQSNAAYCSSTTTDAVTGFHGGQGTAVDPYKICNRAELDHMKIAANLGKVYTLMNDIDFKSGPAWTSNIGSSTSATFTGELNGNGHKIYNFYYATGSPASSDASGLFGYSTGSVHDLTLELGGDVVGQGMNFSAGALAGHNTGYIQNVRVATAPYAVRLNTSSPRSVGGLVGVNYGQVYGSEVNATVSGNGTVGGLAGENLGGGAAIDGSVFMGTVSSSGGIAGGLVGHNNANPSMPAINRSAALVDGPDGNNYGVQGGDRVGGLVGWTESGRISSSFARGRVKGTGKVGGFIGEFMSGIVDQSYFRGTGTGVNVMGASTSGSNYTGGFIGLADLSSFGVMDSFVSAQVQAFSHDATGIGLGGFQNGPLYNFNQSVSAVTSSCMATDTSPCSPSLVSTYAIDLTNPTSVSAILSSYGWSFRLSANSIPAIWRYDPVGYDLHLDWEP